MLVRQMLQSYAGKCRQQATEATAYLCADPIDACWDLAETTGMHPIIHWGIFNPMGPTLVSLAWIDVPGSSEQLLARFVHHPFASEAVIVGLVRDQDEERWHALEKLFEANGTPEHPLLGGLPTYVMLQLPTPSGRLRLANLLCAAVMQASPADMDAVCDRLERFKGRPWERESPEHLIDQAFSEQSNAPLTPPTPVQLMRWLEIVLDNEHLASELPAMSQAWEGAIRVAGYDPAQFAGRRWSDVNRFVMRFLGGADGSQKLPRSNLDDVPQQDIDGGVPSSPAAALATPAAATSACIGCGARGSLYIGRLCLLCHDQALAEIATLGGVREIWSDAWLDDYPTAEHPIWGVLERTLDRKRPGESVCDIDRILDELAIYAPLDHFEGDDGPITIECVDLPFATRERCWVVRWSSPSDATFLAAIDGPDRHQRVARLVERLRHCSG